MCPREQARGAHPAPSVTEPAPNSIATQEHMVTVCENSLKNRLNTAILATTGGIVFGMAGHTRLSANRRQITP